MEICLASFDAYCSHGVGCQCKELHALAFLFCSLENRPEGNKLTAGGSRVERRNSHQMAQREEGRKALTPRDEGT